MRKFWIKFSNSTTRCFTPADVDEADGTDYGPSGGSGESKAAAEDKDYKALFADAVITRDKAKKKNNALTKEIKELRDKMAEFEGVEDKIAGFDEMKKEFDQLKSAKKAQEEADMTELEKANTTIADLRKQLSDTVDKHEADKTAFSTEVTEKYEALEQKYTGLQTKLKEHTLRSVAMEHNAVNPDQISKLVGGEFNYNEDGDLVKVTTDKRGNEVEVPLSEYMADFVKEESNANLFSTKKPPRSDKTQPDGSSQSEDGTIITDQDRRMAELKGLTPEDYVQHQKGWIDTLHEKTKQGAIKPASLDIKTLIQGVMDQK